MKKIFLVFSALILAYGAQAQVRLGFKLGTSSTEIPNETINLLDAGGLNRLKLALNDASYGIHAGLAVQTNLGPIVFQPELVFNSNTVEWKVTDLQNSGVIDQIFKERYNYLDIPVLFGFRFGPLRLNAGPEGHVYLNSVSDLLKFSEYDTQFKELTVGGIGGIGLDIWRFSVDLRYEGNLNKFGDHIRFAGQDYAFADSPNRWLASVTFFMNSRK
ncbi:MAG: outer membrane beta-barrel protein [Haliscomenobacter sp.]